MPKRAENLGTELRVRLMSGIGGELDRRNVMVFSDTSKPTPVLDALIDMLGGADLAEGDQVIVEEIE